MSGKGNKLAQELQSSTNGALPWVVEQSLGNLKDAADVSSFIEAAFKNKIKIPKMPNQPIPKASLVVGAGKLERSKYHDSLPHWTTAALLKLGYKEDQSSSSILSSAGTCKFQHDTGQNLKFVHVFPFVELAEGADDDDDQEDEGELPLVSGIERAQMLLLKSELETFKRMIAEKVGGWTQRKRVAQLLKTSIQTLAACNQKLALLQKLEPKEQELYDTTDADALEAKAAWLRLEMNKMIDENRLTEQDRKGVVEQFTARVAELEQAKDAPALERAKKRLAQLTSSEFKAYRHPLKEEAALTKLWMRSIPLEALVTKAGPKGRWSNALTADEVKLLGDKEDMDVDIERLLMTSRWWYEEDAEIEARAKEAKKLVPLPKKKGPGSYAAASAASLGWTTASSSKKATTSFKASTTVKKKIGGFGALADDDDSD